MKKLCAIFWVLPFTVLFEAGFARAQSASSSEVAALLAAVNAQSARLADGEKKLEESRKALEEHQKQLLMERAQFNELRVKVAKATGKSVAEITPPVIPGRSAGGSANLPAQPQQAGAEVPTSAPSTPTEVGTTQRDQQDKPPEIAAVIDQGGVLLKKGKLVVTPSTEYTRSSATRVAIAGFSIIPALNIGTFEITRTDRDTITAAQSLRYGITNRIEVEAKVPYVYRQDATRTRPVGSSSTTETLTNVTGNNIGDAEFAARYQMTDGKDGWPFLIGNMRFKTATGTNPYDIPINAAGVSTELPTGSGFYALQPSVTAILPSDPVVFYSNMGYLHNFERSFSSIGKVSPGDSINAGLGMSMTLNDKAAFSLGYSHNTVFKPTINGVTPASASMLQVGTLDLGYSYNLTDRTNLNFAVSAGITEDAPDARLILRVPITYDLFQ